MSKAQRNDKNINELQRHKGTKNRSINNSVPMCLSAYVPNNKGLTLLEIAISMAILAIALVTLANLFPIGLKFSRRASTFSGAGILAQRVIENIKRAAAVYDNGDDGIGATFPLCSDNDGIGYFELVAEDTAPYSDEATITPTPPTANPNYFWTYHYINMSAVVSNEAADIDDDGTPDTPLMRKVSVAIYWEEAGKERADTFITYVSNPFYEKYK